MTLDTTRADALGPYGHASVQTPTLDALAAESTLFERCFTAVPVTLPSHTTMMTGTYPWVHGVRDNGLYRVHDKNQTLAEILQDAGYATGAAVGAYPLHHSFGLNQGFSFYSDELGRPGALSGANERRETLFFDERSAAEVNQAILPWLRETAGKQPFFAWVHYWDAHHPHLPPPPYDGLFAHDAYLGEISFVDASFGRLIAALKELNVYDRTVIIVTADHGEGRGEHRELTHSMLLYNGTLHVPLIVRVPGAPAQRIAETVGTVDILPTALALLEQSASSEKTLQGRSLAALVRGQQSTLPAADYYAETLSPRLSHGWGELRALMRGDDKLIFGPEHELYDLGQDFAELRDRSTDAPELTVRLEEALRLLLSSAQPVVQDASQVPDAATRARLEALGYVSSSGGMPSTTQERLRRDGEHPKHHMTDLTLLTRTKQALLDGAFALALRRSEALLERDPKNAYVKGLYAWSLAGIGRLPEALALARQPEVLQAANAHVFALLAQRALRLPALRDEAAQLLRDVMQREPTPSGLRDLAELAAQSGDFTQALAYRAQAFALAPESLSAAMALAIAQDQAGALQAAQTSFGTLARRYAVNPQVHLNAGLFWGRHGRSRRAREHFQRALQLRPDYPKARLALLASHLDLNERPSAEALVAEWQQADADTDFLRRAKHLLAQAQAGETR